MDYYANVFSGQFIASDAHAENFIEEDGTGKRFAKLAESR